MSELDDIRGALFKSEGEFVEQLKSADKSSPEVRTEALTRLNLVYRFATIKGRGRFLDEMKLEGAGKERKVAFDMCKKAGKPETECDGLMEKIPLFRPLLEAWPKENTATGWWSAPLTHLIGTYDPNIPPAGELPDWRDQLDDPLAKGAAIADDVADVVVDVAGDVVDEIGDISDSIDDAVKEQQQAVSWLKVGATVGATVITGAIVYRIVKGA